MKALTAEQLFKSRDSNNDGVLTREEFCANKEKEKTDEADKGFRKGL